MVRRNLLTCCLLLAIIAWPTSALALTIPLDNEFGQDLPGTFGEVILTDLGNNIKFEISIIDPLGGTTADLLAFYFNIDPDFMASDISFVFTTPSSFMPADSIDYTASNAAHMPDGDGFFEIVLNYTSDTTGAGCGGQGCLQSVVFEVAVTDSGTGMDVDLAIENFANLPPEFNDTQSVGGAKGAFTVAVRITRLDGPTGAGEDSAWVGGNPVPEPMLTPRLLPPESA